MRLRHRRIALAQAGEGKLLHVALAATRLPQPMKKWLRAAIFDFDGVLVSSEPLHFRALKAVLGEQSVLLDEAEYYREMLGMTDRDTFAFVYQRNNQLLSQGRLAELITRKSQLMLEMIRGGEMKLLPGAAQFVRQVRHRCPTAICSGSRRVEIQAALEQNGLDKSFSCIISADDFTISKPDPAIYLHTLQQLCEHAGAAIAPRECLVIEDSPTVVRRLRPQGFRILAITSSVPAERFEAAEWVQQDLSAAAAICR